MEINQQAIHGGKVLVKVEYFASGVVSNQCLLSIAGNLSWVSLAEISLWIYPAHGNGSLCAHAQVASRFKTFCPAS